MIAIFYFISGIFYYIGSTVNPIFYHLFSRKYRLAFTRTMQRIVRCKRHHHYRLQKKIPQKEKSPLVQLFSNPVRTTKLPQTVYRSPGKLHVNNQRAYLTRLSLPGQRNPDRMRQ